MGEDLCRAYNRDFNISSVVLRPFNIYGYGQNSHFLVPMVLDQAESGKINLKDSRPKRDFIFIEDVVNAYIKSIGYTATNFEVFNIGSGVSTSIKELTDIVSAHFDDDFDVSFTEEQRKNEVLDTRADITKAKKLLKWKPKVTITEGISQILNK